MQNNMGSETKRALTKKPLSSFAGAWADIDTDEIKKIIKNIGESTTRG